MGKKVSILVLLLLLLLVDEFMVQTEARTCSSRSRKFKGKCLTRNKMSICRTICKGEKFITGQCSRGICFCLKKCGNEGHPPPRPPPSEGGDGSGEGGGEGGSGGGGEGGELASLQN